VPPAGRVRHSTGACKRAAFREMERSPAAKGLVVAVLGLLASVTVQGFYLPGVAPQDYARDDIVNLKVNKLSSTKTQLPYEYYSLPYCRPDPIVNSAENLGEVLRGDRIENSLYQIEIRLDEQCKVRHRPP
jgi:transmembrane 9 superfamily protein 2/4